MLTLFPIFRSLISSLSIYLSRHYNVIRSPFLNGCLRSDVVSELCNNCAIDYGLCWWAPDRHSNIIILFYPANAMPLLRSTLYSLINWIVILHAIFFIVRNTHTYTVYLICQFLLRKSHRHWSSSSNEAIAQISRIQLVAIFATTKAINHNYISLY